ncbi:MAG: LytTR family DNA-binding domain-containing protein [Oscillospiraceae bacterium]
MKIAIVDDRLEDQAELAALLERYGAQNRLSMDYRIFSSAEELLCDFRPEMFQIVFLDIYMNGMDGMQAARQLSQADPRCRMIFSTTSHTHAVESYEVRAAYYLTKPLDYTRLCTAMTAACAELLRDSRCMALHCAGLPCEILLRDILFVDCAAERTRLHLMQRLVTVDERVSEVFALLSEDTRFLNCNRNVTVNMDHIVKTQENNFLLESGENVPIRQRDCGAVKREFLRYSLRALRKEVMV